MLEELTKFGHFRIDRKFQNRYIVAPASIERRPLSIHFTCLMGASMDENKILDLNQEFLEMEQKAKELNPDIENAIEIFNSTNTEISDYYNYLNLINQPPVSFPSNHVQP